MAKNQGMIPLPVSYSLTLMLLFSLISPSTSLPRNVKVEAHLLDSICTGSIDTAFCLATLKSDPRTASADLPRLAQISLELAQAKAASILTLLDTLNKSASDSTLRQRYNTCTTHYTASSGDLTKAAQALKSSSYVKVGSYAVTAMDKVESCKDEFEAPPKDPSPLLTTSNTNMVKLCNILVHVSEALTK